jgi:alkylated DNA repair dioxygenase AlkB
MQDLFASEEGERLDLPDADVRLYAHALSPADADTTFQALLKQTQWLDFTVVVWGKTHPQPRRVAWYGDPGTSYGYSGAKVEPLSWTPLLDKLRRRMESITGGSFNSVLLNLYRDGNDNLGMHSDNESELGPTPLIASLSLGESRDFQLKHRSRADLKTTHVLLSHGSLLVMAGQTQQHWKHGLRRETRTLGPRINLTFRHVRPRPR